MSLAAKAAGSTNDAIETDGNAAGTVLALNAGSSSIKAGVYRIDGDRGPTRLLAIEIERVGSADGSLRVRSDGDGALERSQRFDDFDAALRGLFGVLDERGQRARLAAVGHRVVHGGPDHFRHERITPEVVAALRNALPLARNHMPQALAGIDYVSKNLPHIAQVACFDTAFHRTMPPEARRVPLPPDALGGGLRFERYGFHGLSYEYVCAALAQLDSTNPPAGNVSHRRLIVAHLGSGASMAAIRDGKSVDTTMGFTPNSGLLMGTRSGDIDPGILTFLMRERKLSADALDALLERQSGLLGVSGTTADMRELLQIESSDPRAAEAIALFCHRAKKYLGAYASVLGGVDALVFSGGIGERAAGIRARICADQQHLGIHLDAAANAAHAPVISSADSGVTVRVIATDEESMIVRHTRDVLAAAIDHAQGYTDA